MSGCRVIGIVVTIGCTAIMCVRANGIAGTRTNVTIGGITIMMIIIMVIIIDSRQRSLRSCKLPPAPISLTVKLPRVERPGAIYRLVPKL